MDGMETVEPPAGRQPHSIVEAGPSNVPPLYEMHHRPVDARLAGQVDRIVGYRESGCAPGLSSEAASLVVPLVISFAEPFEIALGRTPSADDSFGSFTSGLFPGCVLINSGGGAECIQIDFTPLGAYRFFGLPMAELAGRMVTLDDLGDRAILELRERLAGETDWERRLTMAEAFVAERLRRAPPASAEIAWAYGKIVDQGGAIRIQAMANSLDWSRKHLNVRFRHEIGIGPKTLARMARFNRALAMARTGGEESWAAIAAAAGYADQAHMVREFREFAGSTPAALGPDPFELRR